MAGARRRATGGAFVSSFRSRRDLAPASVAVTTAAHEVAPGFVFVATANGPGQRGPMILDDAGRLVWFRPLEQETAMNFAVQQYRGAPVLTWWQGTITDGHGAGVCVIADDAYRDVHRVQAGNGLQADLHEFQLTDEGTALITAYETVTADLSSIGGPTAAPLLESAVQEIDVATGEVLLDWRARDHIGLDESYASLANVPFDYFHVNSVSVANDGNLLVSARNTWALYKLDRKTGEVLWRLGGKRSDFMQGPGADFYWQHHSRQQPDGTITIFDDGAEPKEEPASRAIQIALDPTSGQATLVRQFVHPDGLLAVAMGSVEILGNGDVFVGWGTEPAFSEFAADGTLRFDARFAGGGMSYRAFRFPWRGRPDAPPRLEVRRPHVYASWNGATDVTRWRLETGPTERELRPAGSAPRTGFETELRLEARSGWVAVAGLDRSGRVLGRSAAVRL